MLKFSLADLGNFDDEALRTFLDPRDGGIDPDTLGQALQAADMGLVERVGACLPPDAARRFRAGLSSSAAPDARVAARGEVLETLFWPLLYWNRPEAYEELIAGEDINPAIVESLGLAGRVVCDIGAGAGRFTLPVAQIADRVIAVDAVPALLARLESHAARAGLHNIETRRGSFTRLPLEDESVDVAVACSSFTPAGPHGGGTALREADRITRDGGTIAVVWPQQPEWLEAAGFTRVSFPGDDVRHFRSVADAERLCRDFYSDEAALWVRAHHTADVPFDVLGQLPPNEMCVRRR
jgi:SAM-dependent methyltransferase